MFCGGVCRVGTIALRTTHRLPGPRAHHDSEAKVTRKSDLFAQVSTAATEGNGGESCSRTTKGKALKNFLPKDL